MASNPREKDALRMIRVAEDHERRGRLTFAATLAATSAAAREEQAVLNRFHKKQAVLWRKAAQQAQEKML